MTEDIGKLSWFWLKVIPWSSVVSNAPNIYQSVKSLLDAGNAFSEKTSGDKSSDGMQERISQLEKSHEQACQILEVLAEKNLELEKSVRALQTLVRALLVLLVIFKLCFLFWLFLS